MTLKRVLNWFRELAEGTTTGRPHPLARPNEYTSSQYGLQTTQMDTHPEPVQRKLLLIVHKPIVRSQGNRPLGNLYGWNDPDALVETYIHDIRMASYGYANFQIAERIEVDAYPLKTDGFRYDEQDFLKAWRTRQFHQPDAVAYHTILDEFEIITKLNRGDIDEVWLMGFPYCGYYESIMAGPGAYWCNAPALLRTDHAERRFIIMGFNYERGVGEMLENMGHRAESILTHVFRHQPGADNLFERFTRYDLKHPGRAECGNVHFAPNSLRDYDWGNPRPVQSTCDNWYHFPDLSGPPRIVDSREWGGGDIRAHHLWWFRHFPHIEGATDGIAHNWWRYVIDPNTSA